MPRRLWGETELERLRRENEQLKETERLRRENEELKSRLQGQHREEEGQHREEEPRQNTGQGVRPRVGLTHRMGQPLETRYVPMMERFPSIWDGFMSSFFWPMERMAGNIEPAQSTMNAVQDAALAAILHSGRLGSSVECGQVSRRVYSSVLMNGHRRTDVELNFHVQGEQGSGLASCRASIGPDQKVEIRDLWLDGDRIDSPPIDVKDSSSS